MPVTLRQDRRFSYVWVEDLAAVVERALDVGPGGVPPGAYNVTPGQPIGLRAIAEVVAESAGGLVQIEIVREGLGLEYSGDGSRLAAAAPNVTTTGIAEGIQKLLGWYGERIAEIDKSALEFDR